MDVTRLLIDNAGLCLTKPIRNRRTALHYALQLGSELDVIQLLLEKDKTALFLKGDSHIGRKMPLHMAPACKHPSPNAAVIEYIVGLDRNVLVAVDDVGYTPLHFDAKKQVDAGIVEFLARADRRPLTMKTMDDETPLRVAMMHLGLWRLLYMPLLPLLIDDDEVVLTESPRSSDT